MKFETTPAFDTDYRRLKAEHAAEFKKVVRDKFVPACDAFAADPATPWPASLRVKAVRSAAGVREMTWSFASPDGRATFERHRRRRTARPMAPHRRPRRLQEPLSPRLARQPHRPPRGLDEPAGGQQIGNSRTENSPVRPTAPNGPETPFPTWSFIDLQLRHIVIRRLLLSGSAGRPAGCCLGGVVAVSSKVEEQTGPASRLCPVTNRQYRLASAN